MIYEENKHYGHAEILLNHCGLPPDTPIPHRVQHGWQPGPGMSAKHMSEPGSKIIWSARNLASAEADGFEDGVPIGAPFLYLPHAPAPPELDAAAKKAVLSIPFHGWEKGELHGGVEAYAEQLAALEQDGFGPVTVCMYWFEYEQPALRAIFESRGFNVTTMGHRGDNPEFLERQRRLISDHGVVTSNRVSTATFYALSLGVPFFLWGPVQGIQGTDDTTGERYAKWQRETYPELTREAFSGACERDLGLRELGAEYLRAPDELRAVLNLGPDHAKRRNSVARKRRLHNVLRAVHLR